MSTKTKQAPAQTYPQRLVTRFDVAGWHPSVAEMVLNPDLSAVEKAQTVKDAPIEPDGKAWLIEEVRLYHGWRKRAYTMPMNYITRRVTHGPLAGFDISVSEMVYDKTQSAMAKVLTIQEAPITPEAKATLIDEIHAFHASLKANGSEFRYQPAC